VESKTIQIIRWVARISAAIAAGLILLLFVGEVIADGIGPLLRLSPREALMMVAFFAVWLGLILGWRWELLGGSLTVMGLIAFYLLDFLFSGTFPRGPYFLLFASPSVLFLYAGWREKRIEDG
jgi:hypothetical protein